jgi:hypothetical protein
MRNKSQGLFVLVAMRELFSFISNPEGMGLKKFKVKNLEKIPLKWKLTSPSESSSPNPESSISAYLQRVSLLLCDDRHKRIAGT